MNNRLRYQGAYSDSVRSKALRLYAAGLSPRLVAQQLGLSQSVVWKWATSAGIARSRSAARQSSSEVRKYSDADRRRALRLYAQGATGKEVAERLGISVPTVLLWVRRSGSSRTTAESNGVTRERVAQALELYESGLSQATVARATGLGRSTIQKHVAAAGLSRSSAEMFGFPESLRNDAIALYLLGLNTYEVALQLNVSSDAVGRWVRREGISRGFSGAQALRVALGRETKGYGIRARFKSEKGGGELYAASVYELARMHQLEADVRVETFFRIQDRIPYGGGKMYVPDLEVHWTDGTITVEEIKPAVQMKNDAVRAKASAAFAYYAESGKRYCIISEADIGEAGFKLVNPKDYSDCDRIKATLKTARWIARRSVGLDAFSFATDKTAADVS